MTLEYLLSCSHRKNLLTLIVGLKDTLSKKGVLRGTSSAARPDLLTNFDFQLCAIVPSIELCNLIGFSKTTLHLNLGGQMHLISSLWVSGLILS